MPLGRFAQLLVKSGLVTEAQIATATAHCPDVRVCSALIITRTGDAAAINRVLAQHHGLVPLKLAAFEDCDPAARALVPPALARRLCAVAIAITGTGADRSLLVAMRDPGDLSAVDELAFAAGMKIDARIVPEIYLHAALERGGPVSDVPDPTPEPHPPDDAPAAASEAAPARTRTSTLRPLGAPAPVVSPIPVGPDPYAPSIVGRVIGLAIKGALLVGLVIAGMYGYRTCLKGNTSPVGTHYASKALGIGIDFPDNGWRVAPAIGKKMTTARAEYFYRGNAPEFPIVGMLLVRSSNTQAYAAAASAEALLGTIIRNPKLRGCEGSDARSGAIMCVSTGALELFGMIKGVGALVEVHAWANGPDIMMAAMIQPDKTTKETQQILTSIGNL